MSDARKRRPRPGVDTAIAGHVFADPRLLAAALTHPSVVAGGRSGREAGEFERLEFLGDRVLGLVVAEMLYERYPEEQEGDLSRRHAALVSRGAMAELARQMGLDRALRRGADGLDDERGEAAMLADAFEAVLAAIYRDGGYAAAVRVARAAFAPLFDRAAGPPRDAKTALQEWAQARGRALPVYTTLNREGPPHRPHFVVEARVEGLPPRTGAGSSKRLAEGEAATALLARAEKTK